MPIIPDKTILNKYRILKLIGEGGMARVWLAEEVTFGNRQVALKEPRSDLLPDDLQEVQRRYQREVRVCAALKQARVPNIVPSITAEPYEGSVLLVMDYMSGGDLAGLLRDHPSGLPVERAVTIALDVLRALHGAHEHPMEIVHRDVKPSNILFDGEGKAHLSDFGLAQLAGASQRSKLRGGQHPGTPLYMAPEQATSPDYLPPAADLFALGCVLFEMLTGKRYKRVRPGTGASSLRAEAPGWLDEVLARALQEDPWDRWQSAGEMAAALQAGLQGELEARQQTRREAHEEAQQQTLAKLYEAAQAALREKRWPEAIQRCDGIVAMDAGYRDIAQLRAQAEAGLRAEQEAEERKRQRRGELGRLYETAREALKAQDWNAALRRCEEIERLEPGYRDVAQIKAQAQARLREQREEKERERRRRAKVAALYEEAQRLLGRRKHQAALDKMAALGRLEPTHADPQKVEGRAREGLAKGAELRPFPWAAVLGVLLVVAVIASTVWGVRSCKETVLATLTPTPTPTSTPTDTPPPTPTLSPTATRTALASPTPTPAPTSTPTDTPVPTPTDSPTATRTPLPDAVVESENLNLRSGPGTVYDVLRSYPGGTIMAVQGKNPAEDWLKVKMPDDRTGWMNVSLIKLNLALSAVPLAEILPTPTPSAPAAGATQVWEKDGSVMVYVPAGEFLMGSSEDDPYAGSDEHPQHTVYLDGFWIDRTEVTNERYGRCVAAGACQESRYANDDRFNDVDQPVVGVSWYDAQSYCEWAGKRQPAEAEWEKAARGTDGRLYPWGNEMDAGKCNTREGGMGGTSAVGAYSPAGDSPYGCADMAGNVWEWVADWYGSGYYSESSATRNPTGPYSGDYRVLRGGSWSYYGSLARSASRRRFNPVNRYSNYGFRCCVSPTSSL